MKSLAAKLGLFVLLGVSLLVGISRFYRPFHRQVLNDQVFTLSKDVETLTVGDSHPQAAIDPDILPHSANISISAEGYFFTYYKLRFFLDHNHGIKRIIIGFTYHNIAKKYQEGFLFDPKETPATYSKYFLLLDDQAKKIAWSMNPDFLVNWLKVDYGLPLQIYKDNLLQKRVTKQPLTPDNVEFFGGFYADEQSHIDPVAIKKKVRRYFWAENGRFSGISQIVVEHLNNILDLCLARHIEVYLLNSPLMDIFKKEVPAEAIAAYQSVKKELFKRYPQVIDVDLSQRQLPTNFFLDGDHVNAEGAKYVSKELARIIKQER